MTWLRGGVMPWEERQIQIAADLHGVREDLIRFYLGCSVEAWSGLPTKTQISTLSRAIAIARRREARPR